MKKLLFILACALCGAGVIACIALFFALGPALSQNQLDTLSILGIIMGAAALYCFVVGEITRNNSQMDKLWSILPIAYTWVVAGKGNWSPRLIIMAILVTLWGIRLTSNFARKGAYKLKFWAGEEDYRWAILRKNEILGKRWVWALFDLFFICFYQNLVVLLTTMPSLAAMDSLKELNWVDFTAFALCLGALGIETIADEQQFAFQNQKWKWIKEGKELSELPTPYDKGFNTFGLWKYSRHPNYLGEQAFWVFFYLFSVAAGLHAYNWSAIGALLLILIFLGSSTLGESITGSKYPEYAKYQQQVSRFFFFGGYED